MANLFGKRTKAVAYAAALAGFTGATIAVFPVGVAIWSVAVVGVGAYQLAMLGEHVPEPVEKKP